MLVMPMTVTLILTFTTIFSPIMSKDPTQISTPVPNASPPKSIANLVRAGVCEDGDVSAQADQWERARLYLPGMVSLDPYTQVDIDAGDHTIMCTQI